jgi:class 3 adenylate cyclase/tRNA A-37 threonylcarbamoyl transferase component Bud32
MSNHAGRSLQIGTLLNDKWLILEFIGKGAMGEVYRAHQVNLKRDAAIKVVSPEWLESFEDDEEEIAATFQRFRREVEAMAPIRHPNVLQIFDYDSTTIKKGDQEIPIEYIVMEFIPGNTLRTTMSEEGFYPDEAVTRSWILDYFLPVLGGVQAIHQVGIVHRDLKPENILLDGNTPKIADFGLARSDRLRSVTQSVDSKGTPPYMSPEQFSDFKRVDERTDVYALGKILYEAIDGKMTPKTTLPFQCATLEKAETLFFQRLDQIVCDSTAEDKTERLESVEKLWNLLVEGLESDGQVPAAKKEEGFRRELTAILSADVAGYSRLMQQDEMATILTLKEYREIIGRAVGDHHGRLVGSSGGNALAEFGSVANAVECAVEIQETLKGKNADLPEDHRVVFRVGINLGDVVKEGDQVYGDGVNAAIRIAGLAVPGGICISRAAHDQVKGKVSLEYQYLGEHHVKDSTEPIRVYRIQTEPGVAEIEAPKRSVSPSPRPWKKVNAAVAVALVVVALLLWKFYPGPGPLPPQEPLLEGQTTLSSSADPASPASAALVDPGSEMDPRMHAAHEPPLEENAHHLDPDRDAMEDAEVFPLVEEHEPIVVARVAPGREDLEARKSKMQDKAGGVPEHILKRQTIARVEAPSMAAAVSLAQQAAREAADKLIDHTFHKGDRLRVPQDFKTIQSALDHAKAGDIVIVKEGRYFESVVMKDGVKLVSDSSHGGERLVPVDGAQLRLPARTLRTIIDGSKARGSAYWVVDFGEGTGRHTMVDGFTVENLPVQEQHILANAQAVNVRGGAPIIMNCYIRKNASMGLGSHVVFKPVKHKRSKPKHHFVWTDVKRKAEPVIYGNVISQNLGQGILCNAFSAPHILGNEFFLNAFPYSAELGQKPSAGIGTKYGAAPTVIGNIVHDQPGGGILLDVGRYQDVDDARRPPQLPGVLQNLVFRCGEHGPSILCGGGTRGAPVRCVGNLVYDAGWIGIDLLKDGVCIVEENAVFGAAAPGIRVDGATVVKLNRNKVTGANAPGFIIKNGGEVLEMVANVSDLNKGPRFVLRNGTIGEPAF